MQTNSAGTSNFVSSEGNFEHCHPIQLYIRYPFISDMYIEYDKSLHKVASVVWYHTTQEKNHNSKIEQMGSIISTLTTTETWPNGPHTCDIDSKHDLLRIIPPIRIHTNRRILCGFQNGKERKYRQLQRKKEPMRKTKPTNFGHFAVHHHILCYYFYFYFSWRDVVVLFKRASAL